MPRSHPLAESIDARRWEAEAPLGRIVLVAHAAFLHAGFVSYAGKPAPHRPLPTQVGLTASTLPLRYTIPELVVRAARPDAPAAAVLRLCAHGDLLILYGYLTSGGRRPVTHWACIDARLVAPALSSDLDATTRALAGGDAEGARIWNALADGVARRLFADICAALLPPPPPPPPPRLTALPDDLQVEILGRLGAVDLAMVECTCKDLRGFVFARELWTARYMAERRHLFSLERSKIDGSSRSSKEKYAATMFWCWIRSSPPWMWKCQLRPPRWLMSDLIPHRIAQCEPDCGNRQDPTKHLIRRFLQRKSKVPIGDGHQRRAVAVYGNCQRRWREEAVYSPSSARHGWRHR